MIAAIVPVRHGSTRVPHKTSRPFADKSLLQYKLDTLVKVPEIDRIIVTTDCHEAKEQAQTYDQVMVLDRDPYYASSECQNYEFFEHIAQQTPSHFETLVFAPATAPFVSANSFSEAIQLYRSNLPKHDAVVSCHVLREHLWWEDKPINYDLEKIPQSQTLPNIYCLNYAVCVISRELQMVCKSVTGYKPYFYEIDQLQSVDIDTWFDFSVAERLMRSPINYEEKTVYPPCVK